MLEREKYCNEKTLLVEVKSYYLGGQLLSHYFTQNDEKGTFHGKFKYYYPNGQLKATVSFNKGLLEGEYKRYHDNGQLQEIGTFKNGYRVGIWKKYDKNGNLINKQNKL